MAKFVERSKNPFKLEYDWATKGFEKVKTSKKRKN